MRISINLATRPFVELRPLFARLRLTMIVLAVVSLGLVFGLHGLRAKAKVATAQMDALKAQTAALQQERSSNEARMKQPQNQSVLERSQFLNSLFAQKSFSWTAVMMDLERVLPGGVQVTSIEPVISKEGDVTIRMRVTGDRDKAIQLVRNLETSQRFVKPRLGGETALSAEKANAIGRGPAPGLRNASADSDLGNGVEFEIFSGYNPLPAVVKPGPGKSGTAPKQPAKTPKTGTGTPKPGTGTTKPGMAKVPPVKAPAAKAPVAPKPAAPKPMTPSARPVPPAAGGGK